MNADLEAAALAALQDMRYLQDQLTLAPVGVPITLTRSATGIAVALPRHSVMASGANLRDALHILQLGDGT